MIERLGKWIEAHQRDAKVFIAGVATGWLTVALYWVL